MLVLISFNFLFNIVRKFNIRFKIWDECELKNKKFLNDIFAWSLSLKSNQVVYETIKYTLFVCAMTSANDDEIDF